MNSILKAIIALAGAGLFAACSGSSSSKAPDAPNTTLTISGALATSSSVASISNVTGLKAGRPIKNGVSEKGSNNAFAAVTLSDLKFYAIAFTTPPVIAEAALSATGEFSVDLPGAKGASVTAIFKDTDGGTVGTVVFEDSSKKDMNGNAKQSSSVVLTDKVSLGNITLGTDGKVVIPVAQIASQTTTTAPAAGVAFDFTGTWTAKAYDGTLPTGYTTAQAASQGGEGGGPSIDFPITFVRMAGKDFTPGASCTSESACSAESGTVATTDAYALSIWGGTFAQGIGACGSKLGFTQDQVRFHGRINVPSLPAVAGNAISFGPYVYGVKSGFGGDAAPFNKPWMKTGATASRSQHDCRPYTITKTDSSTAEGWACKSKEMTGQWPGTQVGSNIGWQVSVRGGGCINTTTSKPVNVTDWSNIGFSANCTRSAASGFPTGYFQDVCTYSNVDPDGAGATGTINMQCTHIGGQFTDNAGVPSSTAYSFGSGTYLGQPVELVASGQLCSSLGSSTDAATLAAYRCYAEAYWQGGGGQSSDCDRDYRFNWSATTPAQFADDSGRGKPQNAFLTNVLNYSADGLSASLEDEITETVTVPTGANSSTFCQVGQRTVISIKKISETRLLFDLKQTGQMNSTDAACQGIAKTVLAAIAAGTQYNGEGDLDHLLREQKMLFYVDKAN